MAKFDMGAAWDDTILLLKSHSALIGAIAAVFLFLPALALSWFGPVPIEQPAGGDMNQIVESMRANLRQMLPYQLFLALFGFIGTIAILRLWLSRTGLSVGEALIFAGMLFPTMVAVQFLSGIMLAIGFALLLIPGLYLVGRLAVVAPVVADRGLYNPIAAIKASWAMTQGNGWAVFFFLFLVGIVILIAALIINAVIGAVLGGESGTARMVGGLIEAAFGAIGSLVSIAISAAIYRQLAVPAARQIFE